MTTLARQDSRALGRFLKKNACELVLAEYGPTALTVLEGAAQAKVPLVSHFHGWDAYVLTTRNADSAAYQLLFEQSAAIIAVSKHMREHLISLGAPANKVVWNPCGASPPMESSANLEATSPRFVSIGRPTPKKGTEVTLLAFAKVVSKVPDAHLDLVGAGLKERYDYLVRGLQVSNNVTLHGSLPHDQVLKLLRTARCYVHPSVTAPDGDREGTPVSILEAMAAGLPIVATKHGGITDVLSGTSGGVLVDEFDVEATHAAMMAYALDEKKAKDDGDAARKHFRQQWSMEKSLSRLGHILSLSIEGDTAGIARLASGDY